MPPVRVLARSARQAQAPAPPRAGDRPARAGNQLSHDHPLAHAGQPEAGMHLTPAESAAAEAAPVRGRPARRTADRPSGSARPAIRRRPSRSTSAGQSVNSVASGATPSGSRTCATTCRPELPFPPAAPTVPHASAHPTASRHVRIRSAASAPSQNTVGSSSTASAPTVGEPSGGTHLTCSALGYTPRTASSAGPAGSRGGRRVAARPNGNRLTARPPRSPRSPHHCAWRASTARRPGSAAG